MSCVAYGNVDKNKLIGCAEHNKNTEKKLLHENSEARNRIDRCSTHPHTNFIIGEFLLASDYCGLRVNHINLEEVGWHAVHVIQTLFLCRESTDRLVFKIFFLIHVFFFFRSIKLRFQFILSFYSNYFHCTPLN